MSIKPLADRVVVRPLEAEETKKGTIIIPETAKESWQRSFSGSARPLREP